MWRAIDAPENFSQLMSAFLQKGLAVSPWLAGVTDRRFGNDVFALIDSEARDIGRMHWTEAAHNEVFGALPMPERLPHTIAYEILASTAVSISHRESGSPLTTLEDVYQAIDLFHEYIAECGFAAVVQIYTMATAYENHHALIYYGSIPERTFIKGSLHRPWVHYSLGDELMLGMLTGLYVIEIADGHRVIRSTPHGRKRLRDIEEALRTAGYLAHRVRQLHISQFNLLDNFLELSNRLTPYLFDARVDFLDWAGVQPGMRVLELGCADGIFTFDAGLADRIGPDGRLDCLDPSRGMLSRSEAKRALHGGDWIEFYQGRAENIPFPDETFDMVLGFAFLHFVDIPHAFAEMRRVVRRGGAIATLHPVKPLLDNQAPFFQDWFAPLQELAARRHEARPRDYLLPGPQIRGLLDEVFPDPTVKERGITLPTLFFEPEDVIDGFIRGVGWFQEELATVPWQAREDLLTQLLERGRRVCAEYPRRERILHFPFQALRAVRG